MRAIFKCQSILGLQYSVISLQKLASVHMLRDWSKIAKKTLNRLDAKLIKPLATKSGGFSRASGSLLVLFFEFSMNF